MALIWRGIFDVDSSQFDVEAKTYITDWLRWKLHDSSLVLPTDDTVFEHTSGHEVTCRAATTGDDRVVQMRLFERHSGQELRTTITAYQGCATAWAWIDLERWSADAFDESWLPIAPAVVSKLLRDSPCRRGPASLTSAPTVITGQDGAALAEELLSSRREIPYIVASLTRQERETGDAAATIDRGTEIQRRVAGIAPVIVLGQGAVTSFSKAMFDALGEGFDVHSGAIRTYLPGLMAGDTPWRHRFLPYSRLHGRPAKRSAEIVAAAIQRSACAMPPPTIWRETLQPLLEPAGKTDDELEAELFRLEGERDQEREGKVTAEVTLELEREAAADAERENDRLRRRIAYLESELQRANGSPAGPTPADPDSFDPDLCGEVPPVVAERLPLVAFPEEQWDQADALDRHDSGSWAKRAWRSFTAMQFYAQAKASGEFTGNFRDYCTAEGAIPVHWIAIAESETTDNNDRYRALRTLPVDKAVCDTGKVYMPAHIKIVPGGSPAPRIHFHDDTSGVTGKVHVGYFGAHLDNKSKS